MNIHFRLPIEAVESLINASFKETLFEGDVPELSARLHIRRRGPIAARCQGNRLIINAPVHVKGESRLADDLLGLDLVPDSLDNTEFSLTAHFDVLLRADENWHLHPRVDASFDWDEKPRIGLGPLRVRIGGLLTPAVERQLNAVARRIEYYLTDELDLAGQVAAAWKEMHLAQRLDTDPPTWLQIDRDTGIAYATALACDPRAIHTQVHIPLRAEVVVQVQAPAPISSPLPPFQQTDSPPESRPLPIRTHLTYDGLRDFLVGKYVVSGQGESLTSGLPDAAKTWFLIEALSLKSDTEVQCSHFRLDVAGYVKRLGIGKRFRGNLSGKLKAEADGTEVAVRLTEVNFISEDLLARLVWRLGRRRWIAQIQTGLQAAVDLELKEIVLRLRRELAERELHPQILLRAESLALVHHKVFPSTGSIEVRSVLEGAFHVEIRP